MGANVVPLTVLKEARSPKLGEIGMASCQQFVKPFEEGYVPIQRGLKDKSISKDQIYTVAAFDRLIGSCDRHGGNIGVTDVSSAGGPASFVTGQGYTAKKKVVFIDNGYTFGRRIDRAMNGDLMRINSEREVYDLGIRESDSGFRAAASMLAKNASTPMSKRQLNKLFREFGLPKPEQKAFWERVNYWSKGKETK